jgi:16S rRNA (guanine966-N2)-methyltransferase
VTRVIAGAARGRRLRVPPSGTRPTSDRAREALFSSVESTLRTLSGRRVLDLYAGSGAVGLEAASRGAAAVTLVEQDRRTAALIRQNAVAVGLGAVEVVQGSVGRHLARPPTSAYDAVFLDPPYGLAVASVVDDLRALCAGWLADDALVVVERSTRTDAVAWPSGYEPTRTRSYGETALWFATWRGLPAAGLRYGHDDLPASPPAQEP